MHEEKPLPGDGLMERPNASSIYKLLTAVFDAQFYLSRYPDVQDAGTDPLSHYVEIGWKEGRDPSPSFRTAAYLKANPQVESAGVCPLVDYVTSGIILDRPLDPVAL